MHYCITSNHKSIINQTAEVDWASKKSDVSKIWIKNTRLAQSLPFVIS